MVVVSTQGEFEGSSERVEGERLLLEATHKHASACAEIRRLTTEGSIGKKNSSEHSDGGKGLSRGSISISGLALPLKPDFVRALREGALEDAVHYFLVLFKYRHRVIATQMLSTAEGVVGTGGRLVFTNLINMRDLDFDFQVLNLPMRASIRLVDETNDLTFASDPRGGVRPSDPPRAPPS